MAGIVKQNMFDHSKELARMRSIMPEKMREAFDRIVLAGKKVIYSKETAPMVDQYLSSGASIAEKLGGGVANVVVMLDNKAQGAIPKDILIPAATVLLFDAADFMRRTGTKVTTEDIGKAYEMMFYGIFEAYGMKPEQVDATFDRMEQDFRQPQQQMEA